MPQHSSHLPSSVYVAIINSMLQQNSSAYSGALLMKCRDRVIKCRDNTSALRLSLCYDIHFCVATYFLYFILYDVETKL